VHVRFNGDVLAFSVVSAVLTLKYSDIPKGAIFSWP
jgi:hypothetical protein